MKSGCKSNRAFTLVEALVVTAVLSLLCYLAYVSLPHHRHYGSRIGCTNKLKNVGLAFRIFATDNNDVFPMQLSVTNGGSKEFVTDPTNMWRHFLAISNELATPKIVVCPEDDGKRKEASDFSTNAAGGGQARVPFNQNTNVSYFVGVDADETFPQSLLSGDRNLALSNRLVSTTMLSLNSNSPVGWTKATHKFAGNVVVADGSVLGMKNSALPEALSKTGLATNRLAIP